VQDVGILVMTHGDFGKAAMESAQLIVGEHENYETVSVYVVDQLDDLKAEMEDKAAQLDTSNGLIVLTDIVGGTPTNLASQLLVKDNVVVAAGLNLPVLIELLVNRNRPIDELKDLIETVYGQGLSIRTIKDLEGDDEDDLL
jgi:PTS system mannose-specific IIA component